MRILLIEHQTEIANYNKKNSDVCPKSWDKHKFELE